MLLHPLGALAGLEAVRRRTDSRPMAPEGAFGDRPFRTFRPDGLSTTLYVSPDPAGSGSDTSSYEGGAPFPVHPEPPPAVSGLERLRKSNPRRFRRLSVSLPTHRCVSAPVRRWRSPIVSSRLPPCRLVRFRTDRRSRGCGRVAEAPVPVSAGLPPHQPARRHAARGVCVRILRVSPVSPSAAAGFPR